MELFWLVVGNVGRRITEIADYRLLSIRNMRPIVDEIREYF